MVREACVFAIIIELQLNTPVRKIILFPKISTLDGICIKRKLHPPIEKDNIIGPITKGLRQPS